MVKGNLVDSLLFYNIVVNRKVLFDHWSEIRIARTITNRKRSRKNMIVLLKCFRIVWTDLPLANASEGHFYSEESMKRWYDVGMVLYNFLTKSARCDVQFHSGLNKVGMHYNLHINFRLRGKMYPLVYCLSLIPKSFYEYRCNPFRTGLPVL
jgi:hypothetical protein